MKHTRAAFTLFEVLLAISLSSVVLFAVTRLLEQTYISSHHSATRIEVDRRAVRILHQFEKDLSVAFLPTLQKDIVDKASAQAPQPAAQPATQTPQQQQQGSPQTRQTQQQKKQVEPFFFRAKTQEADISRKGKKKQELFGSLALVNTNPLLVWGLEPPRLVRVAYELRAATKPRAGEVASYQLVRKETVDPRNVKFELHQAGDLRRTIAVSEFVIADNIKEFFVEYVWTNTAARGGSAPAVVPKGRNAAATRVASYQWGETQDTEKIFPHYAKVRLVLWDELRAHDYAYSMRVDCPVQPAGNAPATPAGSAQPTAAPPKVPGS